MTYAIFAIALTSAGDSWLKPETAANSSLPSVLQYTLQPQKQTEGIQISDILADEDRLNYNGYVVEKRLRKVRYAYPPSWIDVSYAILKRKGSILAKFDDNVYFAMGNNTRFGLFSFLGGPTKQLVISQDISRGGTQWLVNLSRGYRIIFSGPAWNIGREGDDMGIIDLDHDGAYEIAVPITDFYALQDKLPIARIPLPEIIFKYDARAMEYLPANPFFESYALLGTSGSKDEESIDEFDRRAMVLDKLLAYIYVGKQKLGWDFYDRSYKLSDKEEIKRRVKAILNKQPVYKFIYNRHSYK